MDREPQLHAALDEQLRQLPDLVLGLRHRHAVTRNDDHFLRERHHHAGVAGLDGLEAPADLAGGGGAGVAEPREQHVAERAVHGLRHQLREQRTGRAHHRAGDDHRGVVEYEALQAHRESRERVVERDDDRHVGAADRQRHGEPEHQRQHEESADHRERGVEVSGDQRTEQQRRGEQHQVEELLPAEADAARDQTLQFPEGDRTAAEGHRADDATGHRERRAGVAFGSAAIQLHRRDRRRGPAPHAVVERDHLRDVGHGHALAAPPREHPAHQHRRENQPVVGHSRVQERDEGRHQHAGAGPQDAAAGRDRGAHALEPHDEQHRGDEVARLDA